MRKARELPTGDVFRSYYRSTDKALVGYNNNGAKLIVRCSKELLDAVEHDEVTVMARELDDGTFEIVEVITN